MSSISRNKKVGWRICLMILDRLQDAGWSSESIDEILIYAGRSERLDLEHKVKLWTEWAKLKGSIITGSSCSAPEVRNEYAVLLVSLARQEWPDTSILSDPEVVWKVAKRRLTGLVVSSTDDRRVAELIDSYTDIVRKDFHGTAPAGEKVEY